MAPWGLVAFFIGLLYGWLVPGKQDKAKFFQNGVMFGILLAIALAIVGLMRGTNPLGLGTGVVYLILGAVILAGLFILGVWLGDLIEGKNKKA